MKKRRKVMIAAAVLVVLTAGGLLAGRWNRQRQAHLAAAEVTQVKTVPVKRQNLINSISVTGTIKSVDARDVSASAREVKVLEVNCKVGDYVQAGDVMVVLDASDLELKLQEAQNRQALSAYNENKSIETASENYAEAVEDGTDEYDQAVKSEAKAKEALQEAEAELSGAAERLQRREERVREAKEALNAARKPEGGETDAEAQAAYEALEKHMRRPKAPIRKPTRLIWQQKRRKNGRWKLMNPHPKPLPVPAGKMTEMSHPPKIIWKRLRWSMPIPTTAASRPLRAIRSKLKAVQ